MSERKIELEGGMDGGLDYSTSSGKGDEGEKITRKQAERKEGIMSDDRRLHKMSISDRVMDALIVTRKLTTNRYTESEDGSDSR